MRMKAKKGKMRPPVSAGGCGQGVLSPARLLTAVMLVCVLCASAAIAQSEDAKVVVYFFWGDGCPHCEREKPVLAELSRGNARIEVRQFEVWKDRKNAEFFRNVMRAAGARSVGVPATIVGDRLFFGFGSRTEQAIRDAVAACLEKKCPDTDTVVAGLGGAREEDAGRVSLPLLGDVDANKLSLPLFTVIIGALDSFNPCAFFVLLFLLSLLVHARSRLRMLLIGGVFVLFSGLIYFLFMAAWLNIFLVAGRLRSITMAAGGIALAVAAVNIKDFFFFQQGISLSIPEDAKPGLFGRMRGLLRSRSFPAMIGGAMVLAATANAYELLCTAGFPMVYARVLTLHELTRTQYYLYLVLYNLVYVLPLAVIVAVLTATLGARKLTQWQGRQLKLVSGVMMLLLGLLLLIRPALLNSAPAAAALLGAAIALSAAIILLAKRLRPGIADAGSPANRGGL